MSFAFRRRPLIAAALVLIFVAGASAQTTAFTYQGKLVDSGNPANGQYDFQFKLFDALSGGVQQGATLTLNSIVVSNGIFTVNLDFGSNFPGGDRFLEISVKFTGNPTYATLAPRQPVTSTPYSVRSLSTTIADGLSAACINCVTSSQIQNVQGSQVTGLIPVASVPGGSDNYIQNTNSTQSGSNFNVSGNGTAGGTMTANIVSATTQYNIGGSRILSNAGTSNTFVGVGSGQVNSGLGNTFVGANSGLANTSGGGNAFFGNAAGLSNTTGLNNSFFGSQAGQSDTTGASNSFFGYQAGFSTTTAGNNSFFGTFAGLFNSTGTNNTFVGMNAGRANTTSSNNAFFGSGAGQANTGAQNSFFGRSAGQSNTAGASNSFFGFNAGLVNTTGGNNSFFGQNAGAANNGIHNSFFGDSAGAANTASFNAFFGDSAGLSNTTGTANAFFGRGAGLSNTTGSDNSFFGFDAGLVNIGGQNSFFGRSAGAANTGGASNSFFGYNAGVLNTSGGNNSFFGQNAGASNTSGLHNSFFGDSAGAANTASFNAFFGDSAGLGNTTGTANAFFGRGAGLSNTTGSDNSLFGFNAGLSTSGGQNSFFGRSAGAANTSGASNSFFGDNAGSTNTTGSNNTFIGAGADASLSNLDHATAIGAGAVVTTSSTIVLGRPNHFDQVSVPGSVSVTNNLLVGGGVSVGFLSSGLFTSPLCITAAGALAECLSSLRYKTDVTPYLSGLSILKRLHPITFTWKADGKRDVGLGAEHVAKVEPLFTFTNAKGEIEGVKYNQLSVVFINAFKEQQAQIKNQRAQLARQQADLDALKQLVCPAHPKAAFCRVSRPGKRKQM